MSKKYYKFYWKKSMYNFKEPDKEGIWWYFRDDCLLFRHKNICGGYSLEPFVGSH